MLRVFWLMFWIFLLQVSYLPYSSSCISLRVRVLSHRSIRWQFETSVAERSAVAGACVFTVTRRIYVDWQAKERKLKPNNL